METFPFYKRLLSAQDYRTVFQSAKKLSTADFTVLTRTNTLEYPRLGFAISKKNIPLAVKRNKIKRLVKESFRKQQNLKNVDIVIIARRGANQKAQAQLIGEIKQIWQKLAK